MSTSDVGTKTDNISTLYPAVAGLQIPICKYGSSEGPSGKGTRAPTCASTRSLNAFNILTIFCAGPEILLYLHALHLTLKPRWMRVYGYIWPMWLINGEEHFSMRSFTKLPDGLKGMMSDEQEIFIIIFLNLLRL